MKTHSLLRLGALALSILATAACAPKAGDDVRAGAQGAATSAPAPAADEVVITIPTIERGQSPAGHRAVEVSAGERAEGAATPASSDEGEAPRFLAPYQLIQNEADLAHLWSQYSSAAAPSGIDFSTHALLLVRQAAGTGPVQPWVVADEADVRVVLERKSIDTTMEGTGDLFWYTFAHGGRFIASIDLR
jgi:hypothetical protein